MVKVMVFEPIVMVSLCQNRIRRMSFFHSGYEWLSRMAARATHANDSAEEKTRKSVLTIVAVIIAVLAVFWGSAYVWLGKPLSGAIPLAYAIISFVSIGYYFFTKRFAFFRFSQLLLIFLLPFFLMWSLGGFAHSSVVMVWAFFTPLAAMMFADVAHAAKWLVAFVFFTILSAVIDPNLAKAIIPMNETAIRVFFVLNIGVGFAAIFLVLNFFVRQREQAHQAALLTKDDLERSNRQLQENEATIRQLMLTDDLTGVANRRHLDERLQFELERMQRYGRGFSVIMADLDHFKQVNDTYGHIKGDEVIVTFADVLKSELRSADFVARFGGEEFIVILPETAETAAQLLADRVRASMQAKKIKGFPHSVTASFGVTGVKKEDSLEGVVQRVDRALYQAKESGRNQVVVV
ncbi:MAG TPA: diguanylate cyclase [Gammaproteobacteria bacterium]|nr:diguanylate cyclase [Gammaproteobacteria bacterium]